MVHRHCCIAPISRFHRLSGTGLWQDAAKKIDEFMNLYHEYRQFNGSVLVAQGRNVVYEKGFGLANMEWNVPNAPDTKFRLGSITKQFTSMLIMQEVEKGQLRLAGHLSEYLPYYRKETPSPRRSPASVRPYQDNHPASKLLRRYLRRPILDQHHRLDLFLAGRVHRKR
jgi:CubicO group peptidase (beta-lactamase class C family)